MTTELRPSVQVEVSQSLAQIVLVLGPQGAGRASEKVPVPRGEGGGGKPWTQRPSGLGGAHLTFPLLSL